jgi:Spy/CpxP family protein refolding chaperone
MYPGMMAWWKHARHAAALHAQAGHGHSHCGPSMGEHEPYEHYASGEGDGDFSGGSFGVRRPLRFLAHKLDLDDAQMTQLASILSDLKTERAQAAVDYRRSTSAIADAVAGDAIDETKLGGAAQDRVQSAERLRDAVVNAVKKIHAMLQPAQRTKLAYLLRTGALTI